MAMAGARASLTANRGRAPFVEGSPYTTSLEKNTYLCKYQWSSHEDN